MDYLIDQLSFVPDTWRAPLKETGMSLFMWADWFCGTRDAREIFINHSSYLISEVIFLFCGLLTFVHAWRSGTRYWFLWIGIVLHGLNTEALAYNVPDFDNFWHSQTMLMFLGRRLPAHILLLYPVFLYTASIAAKRMRLPWWAEGCAVGLGAVLIDLPYDIMGPKLLWWTWHDTDPNIYDRFYHVPWTSLYFHAAFGNAFTLILNGMRKLLLPAEFVREFFCVFIAALGAFWLGALQFIPIYHFLHDVAGVHSEVCTLIFLFLFAFIVWLGDRSTRSSKVSTKNAKELYWLDSLFVLLLVFYGFFMFLVLLADPAYISSTGMHQPIGPNCSTKIPVQTVSGMVLSKQQFLCPLKYDEPYFDFKCPAAGGKPPSVGASGSDLAIEWYTICGNRFINRFEYIAVIWAACFFGFALLAQALVFSYPTPDIAVKTYKRKKA